MSTYRGMDGSVQVDASTVAEVVGWTINAPRDRLEDTVMGDASKTYKVAQKDWSGQMEVRFDYGDTAGQKALVDGALANNPAAMAGQFHIDATKYFAGSFYPVLDEVRADKGEIVGARISIIPAGDLTITWS